MVLQGVYPTNLKTLVYKKLCVQIFIEYLPIIVQNEATHITFSECVNKMRYGLWGRTQQ